MLWIMCAKKHVGYGSHIYYCFLCFKMKTERTLTRALQDCLILLFLFSELSPCLSVPWNVIKIPEHVHSGPVPCL